MDESTEMVRSTKYIQRLHFVLVDPLNIIFVPLYIKLPRYPSSPAGLGFECSVCIKLLKSPVVPVPDWLEESSEFSCPLIPKQ